MKEHFRGVIWPRGETPQPEPLKPVYRYIVVGMLITDKPVEGLEGKNELVVDGSAEGLAQILQQLPVKQPRNRLGDATDVLLQLDTMIDED